MKSVDPGILPQSVCFSFTPSELAKSLYFYPTWCGHYFCTSNYYMKRDTYPPLLIVFIRDGTMRVEYRGAAYEATKGDVVLLDCSEPHYYRAKDGLEFVYMHFDGSNSHEICRHILSNKDPIIRQDSNVFIGNALYNMVYFYENGGFETMFQSSMRIYHIFEYLLMPEPRQEFEEDPIEVTIRYIRENVGSSISLEKLAKIANQSVYYYAHSFKEKTGFSPIDYVINTRLDKAKTLLTNSNMSVEEIAYEIGYNSSRSFINVFKKKNEKSPSQYRKYFFGQACGE